MNSDLNTSKHWFSKGLEYAKLGFPDKAAKHFEKAAWLDSENFEIQFNLGTAYLSMGMFEQALVNFDRVIKIKPKMPDAYGNRAVAYAALFEDELSENDRKRAIKYGEPPQGLEAVISHVKSIRKKEK